MVNVDEVEREVRERIKQLLIAQEQLTEEFLGGHRVIYDFFWQVRNIKMEELVSYIKMLDGNIQPTRIEDSAWRNLPYSLTDSRAPVPNGWRQ